MNDNSSTRPLIRLPNTLIREKNGKLYEFKPDGTTRPLSHVSDAIADISDSDDNKNIHIFDITAGSFPHTMQSRDSREVTPQSEASEKVAPQSEGSGEAARAVRSSVYKSACRSEEQVPEEAEINKLPESKLLNLLPQSHRNLSGFVDTSSYSDKPSNCPEKVTCCCTLFQIIFGVCQ